jgi:hypothetical protein
MKSSQKVISPLTEKNPASPLPSTGAKKSPANSKGRQLVQPSPLIQSTPAPERKLPENWTEVFKDPTLWAELRDIILGSNEDDN